MAVTAQIREEAGEGRAADRQFVAALGRGLAILGCFDVSRPSRSVSEIAALLNLPQPTAWRLCHTMLSLGYLASGENGRLRPALAALRLGYATLSDLPVNELARPYLQDMADLCHGAAGMAVPDGHTMRFIERCESDSQLVLNYRVGSRVPVATSAMGWAYLAGLPEEARAEAAGPAAWAACEKPFRTALAGFEADGFIVNPGLLHQGYNTAAVPILGADGRPRFTLNCGAASSVLSLERLCSDVGPRLCTLAARITAAA